MLINPIYIFLHYIMFDERDKILSNLKKGHYHSSIIKTIHYPAFIVTQFQPIQFIVFF